MTKQLKKPIDNLSVVNKNKYTPCDIKLLLFEINAVKKLLKLNGFKPNFYYFDSAATSVKLPMIYKQMQQKTNLNNLNYFYKKFDEIQQLWSNGFNTSKNNIYFTTGASVAINLIVYFLYNFLKKGDEILLNFHEHASNIFPWQNLAQKKSCKIVFCDFKTNVTIENIIKLINPKTKVIPIVNYSNVTGFYIDVNKLALAVKKIRPDIIIVADATQILQHQFIDLKNSKIDFLFGGFHKIYCPYGLGFFYANFKYHDLLLNSNINNLFLCFKNFKENFFILDLQALLAIKKFLKIWLLPQTNNAVKNYEKYLAWYFWNNFPLKTKFKILNNYNENQNYFIIANSEFSGSDLSVYFSSKKIICRSGLCCAKYANKIFNSKNLLRISFSFLNTTKEIDYLFKAIREFDSKKLLDFYLF